MTYKFMKRLVSPALGLPRFIKRIILIAMDAFFCVISVYIAFYLRIGEWVPIFTFSNWRPSIVALVSIGLSFPFLLNFGLYREIFRYSGWAALMALAKGTFFYGIIFFIIFTIIGIEGVPRTIGIIQPLVFLVLIGSIRALASYWLSNAYRDELMLSDIPRVLVYGAGSAGRQLAGALEQSHDMNVIGFLDDDISLHGSVMGGVRIYSPSKLGELKDAQKITYVLLAIPSASRNRRNEIIRLVHEKKLAIQTLPSMSDLASGKITTQDLRLLDIDDLLVRDPVLPNLDLLSKNSLQKIVMVTGAGGSIGSELCRQILGLSPSVLILIDQSEFALYKIHQELLERLEHGQKTSTEIIPVIGSVTNQFRMQEIVSKKRPDIIYHAAAYKHVPMVESNVLEGVQNNALGTLNLAKIALEFNVGNFVLISTDKAVRPTNVMGASKRIAEMILQALSSKSTKTIFSMVRFGNVLDSSGSVVPRFRQQIERGGPITITDFRMTRYFMTIPEAAQLVIQAGALASGGEVFLLDMGEPVKIIDLAHRMIELSGLTIKNNQNNDGDIELLEIGLRPGEKLYEELLIDGSPEKTSHSRIFKSEEEYLEWDVLEDKLNTVEKLVKAGESTKLVELMKNIVIGYIPELKN